MPRWIEFDAAFDKLLWHLVYRLQLTYFVVDRSKTSEIRIQRGIVVVVGGRQHRRPTSGRHQSVAASRSV